MLTRLLAFPATHWRVLSGLALGGLTTLSLLPLPAEPPLPGNDKVLHLVAWGLAIVPATLAFGTRVFPIAGLFLVWSLAIEWLQPLTGRNCELADVLANAVGLTLGVLAGAALAGWRRRMAREDA